ncbi:MAG: hypothetical protein KAI66_21950, partial [Lentisphaeria bacterium]|nr:hypothetical protein [Lentisphaeria bacterium]
GGKGKLRMVILELRMMGLSEGSDSARAERQLFLKKGQRRLSSTILHSEILILHYIGASA